MQLLHEKPNIVNSVLAILVSLFSCVSLLIKPGESIDTLSFFVYFLFVSACFVSMWRQGTISLAVVTKERSATLLAFLFAIIGGFAGFLAPDYRSFYVLSPGLFIVRFVGIFVFLTFLIGSIFEYVDRNNSTYIIKPCSFQSVYKKHSFFISVSIILICWSPYFIMLFPCSSIAWDSTTAWGLLHGLNNNTNNPVLTTIIYYAVLEFAVLSGHFTLVIHLFCLTQAILFVLVISYSLAWMSKRGTPVSITISICLFFSIMPFIPAYAYALEKDALFGLVFLVYIQLLIEWISDHEAFKSSKIRQYVFIVCSVVLPGLRNGMAMMIILVSLMMLLVGVTSSEGRRIHKTIIICLILSIISNYAYPQMANSIYGGSVMPRESMSVPVQQIGYIHNNVAPVRELLSKDEVKQLGEILDLNSLDEYDPLISDPIKDHMKDYPSEAELQGFWSVWKKLVLNNPKDALAAWVLSSSAYYIPAVITDIKVHLILGYQNTSIIDDELEYINDENSRKLNELDQWLIRTPFFRVFEGIGIYTWILLIVLVYVISRKLWARLVCVFPVLAFMLACCFSPVNGYFRYAFPPIICTLILIPGVLFAIRESDKE